MAIDNKSKFLREAEKYVLQGKTQQAIGEYLKIAKNDPGDVLTLNTIGDLYLRLGKAAEANQYFMRVAESYVRNNFLLKAIAVYKKVLSSDPQNVEVNLTSASLNARQGLNVEARNHYLRVAELYAAQGNVSESIKAFEKIIELDPANSAIQKQLADIYLAAGDSAKAFAHLRGAARAQAKAGDLAGAMASFERALQINPGDGESLRALVDCSLKSGRTSVSLRYLEASLELAPENAELYEMLARVQIEAGQKGKAAQSLQKALSLDESRYQQFFALCKAHIDSGDTDLAVECLDPIRVLLIARRETGRAMDLYDSILKAEPCHIVALKRIADLHSAMNNQAGYLNALDRMVECYMDAENPAPVLECLEKILQINPTSERHRELHRKKFEAAFPGEPYRAPLEPEAEKTPDSPAGAPGQSEASADAIAPKIVEADLLINYGMKDRALQLLLDLEAEDRLNIEVHSRLLAIYREDRRMAEAVEQCLLLAALQEKNGNRQEANKLLGEAVTLDPGLDKENLDLAEYARDHGVELETPMPGIPGSLADSGGNLEIDLSEDLSEIFFKGSADATAMADGEAAISGAGDSSTEEYGTAAPLAPAGESLPEQLQEVDFYLSLGFYEEARSKLDQIARHHTDSAEVSQRYQQIRDSGGRPADVAAAPAAGEADELDAMLPAGFEDSGSETSKDGRPIPEAAPSFPGQTVAENASGGQSAFNALFADLIDEVNAPAERENSRDEFESHFNLGIAYRESDLLDEAIQEFQSAVKPLDPGNSPREVIQCCGMLSTCYLERKMPRSAIRWCQTGLDVPGISSHEALALQYDMGVAHSLDGNSEDALKCLGHIFGIDPRYRDVAQKIDDLKGGSNRNVP